MRRAAALVLGTLAGTGLLVGAKVGNVAIGGPVADSVGARTSAVVTGPGPVTTSGPPAPSVGPGSHSPHPSASAGASGKPSTTPAPGRTSTTPTSTPTHEPTPAPTPSGPKDGTYKASSSEHYGTVSLTVTISGHKITNIVASYASNSPSYCTQKACPKLRSEALTAQSAKIATVSGATYTSEAYIAALSAILKSAA